MKRLPVVHFLCLCLIVSRYSCFKLKCTLRVFVTSDLVVGTRTHHCCQEKMEALIDALANTQRLFVCLFLSFYFGILQKRKVVGSVLNYLICVSSSLEMSMLCFLL